MPSRSSEFRAAESSAAWTFSFHGLGMNFDGDDDAVADGGVRGQEAADDALALAAAVDLGRVEEDDAGLDAGLPGLADRRFGEGLVVAAHAPDALVAPGPRADAERRDGDVGSGERRCGRWLAAAGVAHWRPREASAQARWASTAARQSSGWVSCGEW